MVCIACVWQAEILSEDEKNSKPEKYSKSSAAAPLHDASIPFHKRNRVRSSR